MTTKIATARSFIACLIWISSSGSAVNDLHFWPTSVSVASPSDVQVLFAWPEFKVLLQTKGETSYLPAKISNALAKRLSLLFAPEKGEPIEVYFDEDKHEWGLSIPGGVQLRQENQKLLLIMEKQFSDCLSTLNEDDLVTMESVFYAPISLLDSDGKVKLSEHEKAVAKAMHARFQTDRCSGGKSLVPALLLERVHRFLSAIITGSWDSFGSNVERQAVLTELFRQLLFSKNGLWVRASLDTIRDFVEKRFVLGGKIKDESVLERDYESFIDFILMAKETSGLTIKQYVSIADQTGVHSLVDLFADFPIKKLISQGNLAVTNLHIGSQESTFFFKGE